MDCNSCPLQEECKAAKEHAVEEIGSRGATGVKELSPLKKGPKENT